jgi:hypothetical protein
VEASRCEQGIDAPGASDVQARRDQEVPLLPVEPVAKGMHPSHTRSPRTPRV